MKIAKSAVIAGILMISFSGCGVQNKREVKCVPQVHQAVYTPEPVSVDGKLDEIIWRQAPSYPLSLSKSEMDQGQMLAEKGRVRFAWDETWFYLAAEFEDSDLVAYGQDDQMHHYRYGDVCELFLKPADQNYYWELYVTPTGKRTSFFFPSRSYLGLPDCFEKYTCGLKVAAQCNGTLNHWQDRDTGWTAEMAMPIRDLEAFGYKVGPGFHWTVLASRYNYSRYLERQELSMSPPLSQTSYHLYEEYAILEFVR